MNKPNGYDEVITGGDFTPVELGGHTAVIKRVKETVSKSNKPMIQVAIDFDSSDSQPGYFMDSFKSDTRPDRKWPARGTQYILQEDNDGKCSRSLKSFITSVERSNGEQCAWGPAFESWFVNKRVGVVFGEVEEEYNGSVRTNRKIRYFCNYDSAKTAAVPAKKLLPGATQNYSTDPSGFMQLPEGDADEIPF